MQFDIRFEERCGHALPMTRPHPEINSRQINYAGGNCYPTGIYIGSSKQKKAKSLEGKLADNRNENTEPR